MTPMQKLLAAIAALAAVVAAWGTYKVTTSSTPSTSTVFVADSLCTGGRLLQLRAVDTAGAEIVGDTLFVVASDTTAHYRDTTAAFHVDSGKTMQLLALCVSPRTRYRPVLVLPVPKSTTSPLKPMQLADAR